MTVFTEADNGAQNAEIIFWDAKEYFFAFLLTHIIVKVSVLSSTENLIMILFYTKIDSINYIKCNF